MDSQLVRPPVSRHGFRIEDTGHMYVIHTPSHIQIQWLHSSGLMILEASKASEAQGHGLCGEVGPSWGEGDAFRVYLCSQTEVPLDQRKLRQSARPEVGPALPPGQKDLMSCVLGLQLPARRWRRTLAMTTCHFSQECSSASLMASSYQIILPVCICLGISQSTSTL